MTPKPVKLRHVRYHWEIYLFVIPTLVLIGLFQYYPAASGIIHSFFRWNGADVSEFVGFANYLDLVQSKAFWQSFNVALIIGAWNLVKMIPALLVAVCIHRCRSPKMQYLYRALFVIPMVIPGLITVLIWRVFFFDASAGLLNRFLNDTGLITVLTSMDQFFGWGGVFDPARNASWLGDPRLLLVSCIVWGFPWVGSFAVLTYLAKLQSISKDVYEAAEVDGISWFSKFTKIELPLISGSIYLLLVFVIIDTIKDAGMILALAGIEGGPGGAVAVPALFMLRKAFLDQQMGYACAIGIVLTLVVMLLQKASTLIVNWRDFPAAQRNIFRFGTLAGAVALLWFEIATPMAIAILLLLFPYGIFKRFKKVTEAKASPNRWSPPLQRNTWPGVTRAKDRLLRFLKHSTILGVLAFAFLPLYLMIVVSLKTNKQFFTHPAVPTAPFHPENWKTAFDLVMPSVANSMFVSTTATVLTLLLALCGAYFFARARMPLSSLFWNALLLLMMMPAIANLVPLFTLLRDMNLVNTLTALVLVGISSGQVFSIFVLRNFIQDIPQDLFEAAEIDGASHFRQMMMIVFPLSGPILGTVGVMRFISEWNEFVLPVIIMRDEARYPVMVQLLRLSGEYVKNMGPQMAGYAIASVPIIVLFLFSMKLFIRGLTEGATKG